MYNIYNFFQEFLQLSESVIVHHKNIQTLTTEAHKIVNEICPPIVKILFSLKIKQQKVKAIRFGLETALYHAP